MRRRAKQSDRLALRSVLCAMTQPSTSFVRLNLRLTPVQMLWAPVRWFSGARASRDFHRSLTRLGGAPSRSAGSRRCAWRRRKAPPAPGDRFAVHFKTSRTPWRRARCGPFAVKKSTRAPR